VKVRAILAVVLLLGVAAACGDSDSRKTSRAGNEGGAGGADTAGAGAGADQSMSGRDGSSAGAAPEGGAGPVASVGLDQYCSEIAELYFDFLTTCYGATDFPESGRDSYVEERLARCLEVEPSIEAGRLAFDGAQAARCLAELEANDTCSPFDFLLRAPACTALFSALTEPGRDCYKDATLHFTAIGVSSECQGGYCEADQCPGTCRPFLEDGEPCETGQCGPASACIDGECVARLGEGEACQQDACQAGLQCVGGACRVPSQPGDSCYADLCSLGFNCIEGQCWAKVETGQPCTWRYDCSNDQRCLDRDGDGPEGLLCGPIGELGQGCTQPVDCGPGLFCERDFQMPGTCESLLPIGAECNGQTCESGAWCAFSGLCEASGEEGDDCLYGSSPGPKPACAGELSCMSDGKCHPVGDVGEPCHVRQSESCVEGTFCSREGATCAPLAAMGEYCNPFLPQPCSDELGCLCMGDECSTFVPQDDVHDTLFICGPRRQTNEECFSDFECTGDNTCTGELPTTCQPPPYCLP